VRMRVEFYAVRAGGIRRRVHCLRAYVRSISVHRISDPVAYAPIVEIVIEVERPGSVALGASGSAVEQGHQRVVVRHEVRELYPDLRRLAGGVPGLDPVLDRS
jgi:hypothetical protein